MSRTFVVVGGDAAGMSAASKAKRAAPESDVIVFEKGQWVSYAACGTPYYVKGAVEELEALVAVTPEQFVEERDVDLRLGHEVVAIDTDANSVTVEADGEQFEQPYDVLLVATGAHAIVPPFEGTDLDGVFTIHDLEDARAIRAALSGETGAGEDDREPPQAETGYGAEASEYATGRAPETVAVVGGGYVGVEMAEAFAANGLDVHLFEMLPHVLQPFGETAAGVVEDHLREQGVALHLETAVDAFEGDGGVERVVTEDGTTPVDMVVVGVGVAPNTDLASDAGIELGPTGAIAVDEYGRTSAPDVYAAGDCAEARHAVTGEPAHVPLALTANRAGRAIGQSVAGDPTPVGEIAGTAAVKAFDLEVARTGVIDHERAREAGFDPVSVTITAPSRAHYYPGGAELTIELVADEPTGALLGASIVGEEGVPKRVDTVAAALHAGMTVGELEYLDLTYAPPFGPVWDPVLTAAKVLAGKVAATEAPAAD